ncbi:lipopolysaccharide assembly protein LapB [Bdellovibrio sp. KM01]|uniref:tetratricopeptide repeat protein n=1 Tax=Bdellovibrio sp. KM01 TaxID=2748865 RepID=UPI0015EA8063|nr:tetratricopeptide repeat protein [Bdellovibrio sp. KM01]QLY24783.1 tetratricopeptide repeat protein [Bdellovibrio sp. KM01]
MRKLLLLLIATSMVTPAVSEAQTKKAAPAKRAAQAPTQQRRAVAPPNAKQQLSKALQMAQNGQYAAAANNLFTLARKPELAAERPQIKYILGTMLMQLKLYQTAAFQFVDVIRSGNPRYSKPAIEKLAIVADGLGDDTIMNYAISRVDLNSIPASQKDMVYYRLGEIQRRNREYPKAIDMFSRVGANSSYYFQALYNRGLSELESNEVPAAITVFQNMIDARAAAPVTDTNKVQAQLALARAYYQKKDWDAAIEAYSQVPRDTLAWHDAIFEQSWAMLRAARFRSAMSNFQTLHSAYYEDFYMPESLLLRSIVYLYICKYDEMEKVLNLFETTYGPVRAKIGNFIKSTNDNTYYYQELEKAKIIKTTDKSANLHLPYIVLRNIMDQGDVKRAMNYLARLNQEKSRVEGSPTFRASALGQYSLKILANRSKNTKLAIGDMMKVHLLNMRTELHDLYEQAGFIRYEMINGRKETVKKKIAGKDLGEQIDDNVNRKFYIENGFQYYPFQGEFWLDEIGNYHYLGKQSCE